MWVDIACGHKNESVAFFCSSLSEGKDIRYKRIKRIWPKKNEKNKLMSVSENIARSTRDKMERNEKKGDREIVVLILCVCAYAAAWMRQTFNRQHDTIAVSLLVFSHPFLFFSPSPLFLVRALLFFPPGSKNSSRKKCREQRKILHMKQMDALHCSGMDTFIRRSECSFNYYNLACEDGATLCLDIRRPVRFRIQRKLRWKLYFCAGPVPSGIDKIVLESSEDEK